jgi:histidinol-phosphatase (PHP family)
VLPPDNHVHSEYSWDALAGSMAGTCARAVEIGLPSIAFTEHADFSPWTLTRTEVIPERWLGHTVVHPDGRKVLTPPDIDVSGYLETLERCRERFPQLRILSGVELSEAHWFPERTAELVARAGFQRILASLHTGSKRGEEYADISMSLKLGDPVGAYLAYLAEAVRLIEEFDGFEVLTHIDYPVRYWPDAVPFDLPVFEDAIRLVLRTLARADKIMEFNTRIPLDPRVVGWWREEGGKGVSFASDAHVPDAVGHGFREAAEVARAAGFKPGADLFDFWVRD